MNNWNTRLETLKEQHTRLQQQKNLIAERKANLEKRIQDLHKQIFLAPGKSN